MKAYCDNCKDLVLTEDVHETEHQYVCDNCFETILDHSETLRDMKEGN